MITSLGGTVQRGSLCCMVCNPLAFLEGRMSVLQVGRSPPRKKRRLAVRRLDESVLQIVKLGLIAERSKYIREHPALAILGQQFVCPDSLITNICSSVKFISVANDMDTFSLRRELKQRFFNVIIAIVDHQ